MSENFKALTKDSKHLGDLKEVKPKSFGDFSGTKTHTEFYCREHFIDRVLNYCNQNSLVDVMLSGIKSLEFQSVDVEGISQKCKNCEKLAEFRIDRLD